MNFEDLRIGDELKTSLDFLGSPDKIWTVVEIYAKEAIVKNNGTVYITTLTAPFWSKVKSQITDLI